MAHRESLLLLLILSLLQHAWGDNSTDSDVSCQSINNATDQCSFASTTDSCAIDEGFINYIIVVYCNFSSALVPLGIFLFIIWWLFLFLALAVTADDFFCPSLTVMAKVMRMSDNIAGVTILAFGNGAPDIFSALAAIGSMKNGNTAGLAFGALLGAGVFVTAVVSGAVIISKPFHCMERPMLRDITFYIVAVFYTFYIMQSRQITTLQAVGFLLLYVAYVLVVVVGRYIRKRSQANNSSPQEDGTITPSTSSELDSDSTLPTTFSKHLANEVEHYPGAKLHHHHHHTDTHNNTVQDAVKNGGGVKKLVDTDSGESEPLLGFRPADWSYMVAFSEFIDAVNPVCKKEWNDKKWYGKCYLLVKAPIQFILCITCPVVDYDSERDNWNRHLSVCQIILGPMFSVFAIKQYDVMLGDGFPLWCLVLLISVVVAALAFYFSFDHTPPKWHPAMAFLGFVVAVVWIYSIANEIVNILQLFGVFFQISDAILGLTLLAWGNSIGDLIADTALARRGYPRIGISACFGGPLFNLLLGIGLPFTIACIKNNGVIALDFEFQLVVLTGGLMLSLLSTYIIAPFVLRFQMKRWFGVYLLVVYVAFLTTAILTESGIIQVDVSTW